MIFTEESRRVKHAPQTNSAAKNDAVFCNEQKIIKVYCCNATPLMLAGIMSQLQKSPQIEILGKASSSNEMFDDFKTFTPNEWPAIIILDANVKPMNAIDAYAKISLMMPISTRIIVFDNDGDLTKAMAFFNLHAMHYMQSTTDTNMVDAVYTVANGKNYRHISEYSRKNAIAWLDWLLQTPDPRK
jgi:DNA-binding NarL/FixJ family response regulator